MNLLRVFPQQFEFCAFSPKIITVKTDSSTNFFITDLIFNINFNEFNS
jgi:hypothetical protein